LIESLIADRLKSRLTCLLGQDCSFLALGILIKKSRFTETDEILRNLVTSDLDNWREQRNNSLHEIVKVEEGDTSTWEDRVKGLPSIAADGLAILKKIKQRIQYHQRKQKKEEKEAAGSSPIIPSLE
jgi:hypothetical protein